MNEVCLINDDEVTTPCVCSETSAAEVFGVINNNTDLGHKQTDACRVSVETGNSNDVDSVTQPVLAKLEYCQVKLEGLNKSLPALKDSGAQISLIRQDLIKDLDVPTMGVISVRGVVRLPVRANLVTIGIKPQPNDGFENIAPYIPIIFAACVMITDVDIILSSSVVEQLNDLAVYEVIQPQGNNMNRDRSDDYGDDQNDHRKSCEITVGAVTTRAMSRQQK